MNEIEEFLKRAAAMRARQQQGAQPTAARPSAPPPPPSAPPLSARLPTSIVQDAEVIEAEEVTGDDVANYVTRHLDSGLFKQRAAQLGSEIKSADEAIEAHLHQTFEHRLGQLGGSTARADDSSLDDDETAAAAAKAPATTSFADLLRSPQNLRNAIILSEIFNPPRHRW